MVKPSKPDSRPQIWAEGRQSPPFQPRAFALASVIFARESLSGLLTRCAQSADGFGQTVATGRWRVPENRLGRTGRYLPSVATTAATILGSAEVLRRSAVVVLPDVSAPPASIFDAPPQPVAAAMPAPVRVTRAPVPKRAVAQQPSSDDPDLDAIRAMIGAPDPAPIPAPTAIQAPTQTRAAPLDPPAAARPHPTPDTHHWRRAFLTDSAATGLGYGLLAMALPVGVARALYAHLGGQDLREMVGPKP